MGTVRCFGCGQDHWVPGYFSRVKNVCVLCRPDVFSDEERVEMVSKILRELDQGKVLA